MWPFRCYGDHKGFRLSFSLFFLLPPLVDDFSQPRDAFITDDGGGVPEEERKEGRKEGRRKAGEEKEGVRGRGGCNQL